MPRISSESGRGALAPRHGEYGMRGSESPLTINAINVSWGDFGGHFSCIKSDMKKFGGAQKTDKGQLKLARHTEIKFYLNNIKLVPLKLKNIKLVQH